MTKEPVTKNGPVLIRVYPRASAAKNLTSLDPHYRRKYPARGVQGRYPSADMTEVDLIAIPIHG